MNKAGLSKEGEILKKKWKTQLYRSRSLKEFIEENADIIFVDEKGNIL